MLRSRSGTFRSPTLTARRRAPGFTLVELMMSLAMVLLLTLAVTQIFRVTVQTIGKGNATGEVVRGLDATRIALQIDFAGTDDISYSGLTDESGILPTDRQPAIIISSTAAPAFLSRRDMETDSDYDPATLPWPHGVETFDSDGDGLDDALLGPYHNGRRWFRTDTLSFFVGGHGESQKNLIPGGGGFYGDTTSEESWVWYGHGQVYDGQGELNNNSTNQYPLPGEGTAELNPNNFFANQFALLRTAILLRADQFPTGAPAGASSTVLNDDGIPVLHLRPVWDTATPADFTGGLDMSPFEFQSPVAEYDGMTNQPTLFRSQDSRVDVAGVTAEQYRQRVRAAQNYGTAIGSSDANGPLRFNGAFPRDANPLTWYNRLFARTNGNLVKQNPGRFWINSLVLKPLNAEEVSQASSYLLGGATEFVVEYAGDFLTQLPNGDIDWANGGLLADGVVDFTVDFAGVRHIRFYGMPRDVDADGRIPGPALAPEQPGAAFPTDPVLLQSTDTRPLADYLPRTNSPLTVDTGLPFEKRLPAAYSGAATETMDTRVNIADYMDPAVYTDQDYDWSYLAAWGPGDFDGGLYPNPTHNTSFVSLANPEGILRPSLIRIIVSAIDRQARLEDSVSMELIFRVPVE